MIQIRMMTEDDMQALYGDESLKPLLMAAPWGDAYCIIAEESGKIVGGLSGSIKGHEAALQRCVIGDVQAISGMMLTEGLIRSILYVLDKRGVARAYLTMDVTEAVRNKIGFAPVHAADLPDWIGSDRENTWTVGIKEFLAQDCCGCKQGDRSG